MNSSNRQLFVGLFDSLSRHNFPARRFEVRTLSAQEAKQRIDAARNHGGLCGISESDIAIDERALRSTKDLLEALAALPDPVKMSLEDFVRHGYFVPLQAAEVTPGAEMLLVSCYYRSEPALERVAMRRSESFSGRSSIDASTISFTLFSAVA